MQWANSVPGLPACVGSLSTLMDRAERPLDPELAAVAPALPRRRRGIALIFDKTGRLIFLLTGRCPAYPWKRAALQPEDPCQRESTSPSSH